MADLCILIDFVYIVSQSYFESTCVYTVLILSATTGTNLGLGSLIQVLTGYMLPGNPNAFLFAQTLGSWALAGYGDNYVQDQKMAHYVKIPPRAVFRSQIGTIIITCFVAVSTQNFIMENVKGLCEPFRPLEQLQMTQPMFALVFLDVYKGLAKPYGKVYDICNQAVQGFGDVLLLHFSKYMSK